MSHESTKLDNEKFQKETWEMIRNHLNAVLSHIDVSKTKNEEYIIQTMEDILQANILLGKDIFISLLIEYQRQYNAPEFFTILIKIINSELPNVGLDCSKELTSRFIEKYNKEPQSRRSLFTMTTFLCALFNYEVIHEIVLLQLLHLLLQDINDFSIQIIIEILEKSGKKLLEVSKTAHNMIFEKLREILQSNEFGSSPDMINEKLVSLFDKRRLNYESVARLFYPVVLSKLSPQSPHSFMLNDLSTMKSSTLDQFQLHSDYLQLQKDYDILHSRLLQQISSSSEEEQSSKVAEPLKDMTAKSEIEFKKKIYLIIKSSLSADEAAHKLLKLRIPDDKKFEIVDIIINSSLQDPTYSKFYGLLSERLISAHSRSWIPAFHSIFVENWKNTENWEPNQLRILGRYWGHLLAVESIGFGDTLGIIHLNDEETNASNRVFFKFLLQELVAEMSIDKMKTTMDELKDQLEGLFPTEDIEHMRYSINYFTAIGLGILTEDMRERLDTIQEEEQKVLLELEEQRRKEEAEAAVTAETEGKERIISEQESKQGSLPIEKSIMMTKEEAGKPRASRYNPNQIVPPKRKRERSITPPRKKGWGSSRNRSRYQNTQNQAGINSRGTPKSTEREKNKVLLKY
ncbi:U2-type spliceosomal complex subunit CWC22 NDAI_0B00610 [Naumovozyma dairenensis CBS 421]|uniref:Pre-mRNA-splicing factor CWC22 n=1 Tax=Naumovozyma dairenensis (strain ATCC 10597 / BCRC 20456 / CBS 421 / NBRC 0211 / NRRL Y-12639) TaxID=1071378 RepID=G0W5N4_NAUDC|nr:hypothetical protein NDAI_0B00610 [Naumovozyma dairenensis CBS 421]CCD23095.1 hypothetical protein NDAI_0B00610 [Naumovozyma dairenensis CBS 421]